MKTALVCIGIIAVLTRGTSAISVTESVDSIEVDTGQIREYRLHYYLTGEGRSRDVMMKLSDYYADIKAISPVARTTAAGFTACSPVGK